MNPQYMTTDVINRMKKCQGEAFFTIRGKRFHFFVKDDTHIIISNGTKVYTLQADVIGRALVCVPLINMAQISDLPHASYVYAILMDERIRYGLW